MLIVCSWLYGQSPLEELIYFLDNLLRPLLSILLYVILVEKIDTLFRYLLTVSFNLSSQYISHIMSIDGLITSFEKQVLANASDREIKISNFIKISSGTLKGYSEIQCNIRLCYIIITLHRV